MSPFDYDIVIVGGGIMGCGAALRLASSSRGIKPADMATAGGVSLAHQYRIEAGERTPDALYLFKVCRLMGVTMDSLFHGEVSSGAAPALRKMGAGGITASGSSQVATGDGNVQIGSVGAVARARRGSR